MHLRQRLLPLLALALLGSAQALDSGGIAPALEGAFPTSVAYLDCPFTSAARTCVLVPNAAGVRAANRVVLDFLRARPGVEKVEKAGDGGYTFHSGDTAYRLHVAPSNARPGMVTATLSFTFDALSATHAVCLQPNALFDFARLPSLTPGQYASMATAITCHGANATDPQGRTPLSDAVKSGDLAAVRTLLRGGADPNHIADSGWTPLLTAGKVGTRPILDALLQAGGDPTYVAPDGATLGSLQPFNRNLAAAPDTPAGDAVLPDLPGSLPAAGTLALARPAPRAIGAAQSAAATPAHAPVAKAVATPAHGAASAPAPAPAVAAVPAAVATSHDGSSGATGSRATGSQGTGSQAARSGTSSPWRRALPWLPPVAVLLASAAVLAVMRWRARAAEPRESLSDTGSEWRALSRPKPLTRRRRTRRLEPARPWNDPLT